MGKIQEDLQCPSDQVSAVFKRQHHLLLPGMWQIQLLPLQIQLLPLQIQLLPLQIQLLPLLIQLLPPQIQLLPLQIAVHLNNSRKRDFPLSYWCAVSGLRRESVCSAASNRLPFATSDANTTIYHRNGDTTASLLAVQPRNPPDTPGVSSASVRCHHSDE